MKIIVKKINFIFWKLIYLRNLILSNIFIFLFKNKRKLYFELNSELFNFSKNNINKLFKNIISDINLLKPAKDMSEFIILNKLFLKKIKTKYEDFWKQNINLSFYDLINNFYYVSKFANKYNINQIFKTNNHNNIFLKIKIFSEKLNKLIMVVFIFSILFSIYIFSYKTLKIYYINTNHIGKKNIICGFKASYTENKNTVNITQNINYILKWGEIYDWEKLIITLPDKIKDIANKLIKWYKIDSDYWFAIKDNKWWYYVLKNDKILLWFKNKSNFSRFFKNYSLDEFNNFIDYINSFYFFVKVKIYNLLNDNKSAILYYEYLNIKNITILFFWVIILYLAKKLIELVSKIKVIYLFNRFKYLCLTYILLLILAYIFLFLSWKNMYFTVFIFLAISYYINNVILELIKWNKWLDVLFLFYSQVYLNDILDKEKNEEQQKIAQNTRNKEFDDLKNKIIVN